MLRRTLPVLLLVTIAGCLPPRGSSAITLNYYGRRFCTYSNSTHNSINIGLTVDGGSTPDDALRLIMCNDRTDGDYYTSAYAALDPEAPDPLIVGLMLVHCVSVGMCGPDDGAAGGTSVGITSDMFRFARDLDLNAVRASLDRVSAPPEVEATFMDRLAACQGYIVRAVFEMNPRLHTVYVGTIDRTIEDYRAMRRDLASHEQRYAALRPLMDQALLNESFADDTHDAVRALRDDAVRACTSTGTRSAALCANGPLVRPLTEFLVRSAVGLGRRAEALAEQRVLEAMPDMSDVRYAIRAAVGESMRRETVLAQSYRAAAERLAGSDPVERERLLTEQFGSPPPFDLGDYDNAVGLSPSREGRGRFVSSSDAREREGVIVRVRRRGRDVIVDVEQRQPGYYGAQPSATSYFVPRSEGEHLEPGQWVVLAVEGERAHVIRAHGDGSADGVLVQLRTIRFDS